MSSDSNIHSHESKQIHWGTFCNAIAFQRWARHSIVCCNCVVGSILPNDLTEQMTDLHLLTDLPNDKTQLFLTFNQLQ